jgi:hypothetical protein
MQLSKFTTTYNSTVYLCPADFSFRCDMKPLRSWSKTGRSGGCLSGGGFWDVHVWCGLNPTHLQDRAQHIQIRAGGAGRSTKVVLRVVSCLFQRWRCGGGPHASCFIGEMHHENYPAHPCKIKHFTYKTETWCIVFIYSYNCKCRTARSHKTEMETNSLPKLRMCTQKLILK